MYIDLVKEYWYLFTIGWLFIGTGTVVISALLDRSLNSNERGITRGDAIFLSLFGPLLIFALVYVFINYLPTICKDSEFLNKPFLK